MGGLDLGVCGRGCGWEGELSGGYERAMGVALEKTHLRLVGARGNERGERD